MRTTSGRGTLCTYMQRYGPDKEEDIGIVLQDLCVHRLYGNRQRDERTLS
jgi:hypothetical protein